MTKQELLRKWMPCVSLKNSLILILIAAPFSLGTTSCQKNPEAPEFNLPIRLYATDSRTQTINRSANDQVDSVSCHDTRFNDFICGPRADYIAAIKELNALSYQCEKWKPGANTRALQMKFVGLQEEALIVSGAPMEGERDEHIQEQIEPGDDATDTGY